MHIATAAVQKSLRSRWVLVTRTKAATTARVGVLAIVDLEKLIYNIHLLMAILQAILLMVFAVLLVTLSQVMMSNRMFGCVHAIMRHGIWSIPIIILYMRIMRLLTSFIRKLMVYLDVKLLKMLADGLAKKEILTTMLHRLSSVQIQPRYPILNSTKSRYIPCQSILH